MIATDFLITPKIINASRHDKSLIRSRKSTPNIVASENEMIERDALKTLLDAMENCILNNERKTPSHFENVKIALYIHPRLIHSSDGKGNWEKYFIGSNSIKAQGKSYIVYGFGIHDFFCEFIFVLRCSRYQWSALF